MQPRDKISKSSWTLVETTKDAVVTNITNAARSQQLKIEANQVEKLLALIAASIDEGYHRGYPTFMKIVDGSLNAASEAAVLDATMPTLAASKTSAKKK